MAEPDFPWDIPSSWTPALEAARARGTMLLIGAVDSGKSTLAVILANAASDAGRSCAVVDADVGQSSIGPPACVSMGRLAGPLHRLGELRPQVIDFVGAVSPVGHLLNCAASTAALVGASRQAGAETVIVDTTGLIAGSPARALKAAKVRLLDPEVVVAVQQEDEVEHLLAPYRRRTRPRLIRIPRSRRVKERTRDERASHRQRRLAAYFAEAKSAWVEWEQLPMENTAWTTGEPVPGHVRAYLEERLACEVLHAERRADGLCVIAAGRTHPDDLRSLAEGFGGSARAIDCAALEHLLVGLLGERGETLALGLLEEIDFRARRLKIFSPLADVTQARGMRLGAVRVARDGTQLGSNHPSDLG